MNSNFRRSLLPLLLVCFASASFAATSTLDDLELNVARAKHALGNPKEHARLKAITTDLQKDVDASRGKAEVDQARLLRVARELAYVREQLGPTPDRNATAAMITGSVVDDETGLPLSGALVRAAIPWGPIRSTVTGNDGLFSLRTWSGSLSVDVSVPGYEVKSQVVNVSWTSPVTLEFRLRPGGAIKGKVFDRVLGGAPIYFELMVYDTTGALVLYHYVNDSPDGAYDTGAVVGPGTHHVKVAAPNYQSQMYDDIPCAGCSPLSGTPIVITAGETLEGIDFPLDSSFALTFRVVTAGPSQTPLVGSRIDVYSGQNLQSTLYSDLNGYARVYSGGGTLFAVADGTASGYERALYDGIACPVSCDVTTGTPILFQPGTATSVVIPLRSIASRISGRVTAAGTNAPVKGATVIAYKSSGAFEEIARTTSATTGDYQMATPAAGGSYFVEVRATGFESQRYSGAFCAGDCAAGSGTPVQVQPDGTVSGIDVSLRRDAKIYGVISGSSGPMAAQAVLFDDEGRVIRSVTTNSDGAFEWSVDAGTYYVVAHPVDQSHLSQVFGGELCNAWDCDITTGTALSTANRQDHQVNITLSQGVTIEGDVTWSVDGNGTQSYVAAYDHLGRGATGASSDPDGHYSFRVAPGTYYLLASSSGLISEYFGGQQCTTSCGGVGGTAVNAVAAPIDADFALDSPNGIIRGVIEDARSGAPIAGVVVKATRGGQTFTAGTNASGEYEVKGSGMLLPGTYRLVAESLSHRDQLYAGIDCEYGCDNLSGTAVTIGSNQSVTADFQLSPLLVSRIRPLRGATAGGEEVAIDGTGFDAGTVVSFDGVPATIGSVTPTRIVLTTPAHAAEVVDIDITTSDAFTVSLTRHFEYADSGITSPRLVKDIEESKVTSSFAMSLVAIAGPRKIAYLGQFNSAGPYVGVSDDGTVEELPMSDPPVTIVTAGDRAYIITAFDPQDGPPRRDLWKSDGTATGSVNLNLGGYVTSIIETDGDVYVNLVDGNRKLLRITPDGSVVELMNYSGGPACCFEAMNGFRYFVATESGKFSLFRTDGTAVGTSLVTPLDEVGGVPDSVTSGSMILHDGAILFSVRNEFSESGLFRTDGTAGGTTLLKTFPSSMSPLVLFDGRVHFGTRYGLWATDGTTDGTVAVVEHGIAYFTGLTPFGDTLFFSMFNELTRTFWRTDGTTSGTYRLGDGNYSQDVSVAVLGAKAIFPGNSYPGLVYYATDGTNEGTTPITPPFSNGVQSRIIVHGSYAYFTPGRDRDFIWRSDGTLAGTTQLAGQSQIPGTGGSSDPTQLTAWGSLLFFKATDAGGPGVFVSDGSEAGTQLLVRGASYGNIASTPDRVVFAVDEGSTADLWGSDGTVAGTTKIVEFDSYNVGPFVSTGSVVLFNNYPASLWRTDGTAAGTFKLLDGDAYNFAVAGGVAYFWRSQGELWRSNGTQLGTFLVKSFSTDAPSAMWSVDGQLFFSMRADSSLTYLWVSDGTAAGTKLLKRIPAPISNAVNVNGEFFFIPESSLELWKSDGTLAGTDAVHLLIGPYYRNYLLASVRGKLLLQMNTATGIYSQIGVTDGMNPPTPLALLWWDGYPPTVGVSGAEMFFPGFIKTLSHMLMRTDGTADGTRLHHDFFKQQFAVLASEYRVTQDKIFFTAWSEEYGNELWVMDVLDPRPAPLTITPASGPSTGGTTVEVTGTNFAPGLHFTVGGKRVTGAISDSDSATMTTTAMAPGQLVDVVIHDGVDLTLPKAFFSDFLDVPQSNPLHVFVEKMVRRGVTAGCGNGLFCEGSSLTRGQMAVFLLLSKFGAAYRPAAATGTMFSDVPANHMFAAWIEALAQQGITAGCGGGKYCPENLVTREQMAVFLLVTKEGVGYVPPPATGMFSDVAPTSIYRPWIEELARRGVTSGCGPGVFCPGSLTTRGQAAVFLTTTFGW